MPLPVPSAGGVRTQISADLQQLQSPARVRDPVPRGHLEQGLLCFAQGLLPHPEEGNRGPFPGPCLLGGCHPLRLFLGSATRKVPMVPGPALWLLLLSTLVGMWMSKATFCLILDCPWLLACCPQGFRTYIKNKWPWKGMTEQMACLWQPGALSLRSP